MAIFTGISAEPLLNKEMPEIVLPDDLGIGKFLEYTLPWAHMTIEKQPSRDSVYQEKKMELPWLCQVTEGNWFATSK